MSICISCEKDLSLYSRYSLLGKLYCRECFYTHLPERCNDCHEILKPAHQCPPPMQIQEASFNTPADLLYQGIDTSLTGKPIQVIGKRHWKRLLKQHNATDDFAWRHSMKSVKAQPLGRDWEAKVEKVIGESLNQVKQKYGGIPKPTDMRKDIQQFKREQDRRRSYASH